MKSLFLLLFVFSSLSQKELNEIRISFKDASDDEIKANAFYEKVQSVNDNSALILAYEGAGEVIYSKFLKSKLDKLEHFKSGASTLEEAVETDSNSIEIRFIRLVIQEQTPGFLGYDENIEEDVNFIMDNYFSTSDNIKAMILEYVDSSESFSTEQKNKLKE